MHPVSRDYFFSHVFQKKAMIIKANRANESRLDRVIHGEMHGLNLQAMLANSASEVLHIWHPPKGDSKAKKTTISNVDTDDLDEALRAYNKGASLYFGSSLEFRTNWCKQLQYQMGHDFAGYFAGTATEETVGDTMGEIEVFVSRAGNYTDFHTDFQENFTMQLNGSK